jgi:peptidoglycan/LPS O-acetylase OafA/YrhL
MLQHYVQWCYPKLLQRFLMPFEPGSVAVLVFFFLSGFVITEAAELIYRGRPGAFFANRLLRIVPLFALAIFVSFGALYVLGHFVVLTDEAGKPITGAIITAHNLVANLLMIVPLPGRFAIVPDFTVLRIVWALRVEMAFYLCVAFLLLAEGGKFWRGVSFRTMFNAATAVLLTLSAWYLAMRPAWNPLISFAPYFCAGGTLFFALRHSKTSLALFAIAAILSVLMTFYQAADSSTSYRDNIGATALFVILTSTCIFLATRGLHNPTADRLLGDLSYPVYVGHWLPLLIFASLVKTRPSQSSFGAELATTIMGIGLPLCYFLLIEPVTARLRTLIRGVAIR